MSRRVGSRTRAALALVGLWLLAAAAALLPAPSASGAGTAPVADRPAVGEGALMVRITSMSPAIPTAGDTVTLRGRITNVSEDPVSDVLAGLRVSTTPLPSRGEIAEILAGRGQRTGFALGTRATVARTLAPGAGADFSLDAAVDDLGLSSAGTYMIGAEALGSTGAGVVRQDVDRTFLPWWPRGTRAEPLSVTTLWPLTGPPQRDALGVQLSEDSALAMSPSGRLSTLLRTAAGAPEVVSLVVDPATVADAETMSDGYDVLVGSEVVPGTRSREVATWLTELRAAVNDAQAEPTAGLYGWPDLVAARRGRLVSTLLIQRATVDAATAAALGRPLPSEVAMLADGAANAGTLNRLARAGVRAAVLSDESLEQPGTYFTPSGNTVLETGAGSLPVLVVDTGLAQALAMPLADEADRTAARQRLLAETLTTITELPEEERLLVASPDPRWGPPADGARMVVETLASAPWIRPTPMVDALEREPSSIPRSLAAYDDEDAARELSAQHVGQVRDQVRQLTEYAEVLEDPGDVPVQARTAPARGLSAWFRTDPVAGARLANAVSDELAGALASVRVVSSGSISVSGSSGTIPITVENLGPAPVTVGLEMRSDPPQLFVADPVDAFTIPPGQRTSLEVRAQVAAAGPIPVQVQLVTARGTPFGIPAELTVQSSAYANAARIIVRGALVALLVAVAVHGVRRARRMRAARTPGTAGSAPQPESSERTEVPHG